MDHQSMIMAAREDRAGRPQPRLDLNSASEMISRSLGFARNVQKFGVWMENGVHPHEHQQEVWMDVHQHGCQWDHVGVGWDPASATELKQKSCANAVGFSPVGGYRENVIGTPLPFISWISLHVQSATGAVPKLNAQEQSMTDSLSPKNELNRVLCYRSLE
ncbi:unnamed protein product [Darwinula stevensoni]|uniref:Uncharacterized protein n=1 Tax=Darwinula stevensoni TaxID=69355 RepID=A0A7R8WZU7_9CRUS|nr:unnamed protein product [Darwinula stevensoni]CAG0878615.1 unnamed protein product [Darwinula stevensoni]